MVSHRPFVSMTSQREATFIVCVRTGRHIRFTSPELADLRDRICREHGWEPLGHRFQIYAESPEEGARQEG